MAERKPKRTSPKSGTGNKKTKKDITSWKPGSEAEQAKDVAAPGDFGAAMGTGSSRDRDYVNANTKRADRGSTQPASHEHDGDRSSGAGSTYSGPGSGSGGDVDTDIVGVGFGGSGVAQSGPDEHVGADESDGTSNEFNSPVPKGRAGEVEVIPAQGRNQSGVGKVGGSRRIREGSVVQRDADVSTGRDAQGADAATNPNARGDDAFAGEVSSGEAAGDDLPISPSSDPQGARAGDNQIHGTQKDVRGDGAGSRDDEGAENA